MMYQPMMYQQQQMMCQPQPMMCQPMMYQPQQVICQPQPSRKKCFKRVELTVSSSDGEGPI